MKQRRDLAYIIKVDEDETNMEGDKKPQNLVLTVGIRVKTENYKQDGQKGGTASGVTLEKRRHSREARGKPCMSLEQASTGGRSNSSDVPALLRLAAETYEARLSAYI
ncbi:hypothetical protein Bca52824_013680 [Brassica carinata]|uniref:Uncharacterized protein n=1 Tax=Brassica carinata TaxID=52824 RepID=A0A8X8B3P4_BRACI|nr:hypothetical protein Bca52824_013680 [Brassica carinata]